MQPGTWLKHNTNEGSKHPFYLRYIGFVHDEVRTYVFMLENGTRLYMPEIFFNWLQPLADGDRKPVLRHKIVKAEPVKAPKRSQDDAADEKETKIAMATQL